MWLSEFWNSKYRLKCQSFEVYCVFDNRVFDVCSRHISLAKGKDQKEKSNLQYRSATFQLDTRLYDIPSIYVELINQKN